MMLQEFAEQESLTPQAVRTRIARKQVSQFVAKHRGAARLQDHDGYAGVDLRGEHPHDALQVFPGSVEHAKVVQRPATAEMVPRDLHPKPRVRKYFKCSPAGLRLKVVIEGIRPENHDWSPSFARLCFAAHF